MADPHSSAPLCTLAAGSWKTAPARHLPPELREGFTQARGQGRPTPNDNAGTDDKTRAPGLCPLHRRSFRLRMLDTRGRPIPIRFHPPPQCPACGCSYRSSRSRTRAARVRVDQKRAPRRSGVFLCSRDVVDLGCARETLEGLVMPEAENIPEGPSQGGRATAARFWPKAPLGWTAVALAVVGVGSWAVLPMITSQFGDQYPITDSWVMPAIGAVLIMVAAIVNVLALWIWKQRSVLNIVATVVTVPLALLFTLIVVGEGLAGVLSLIHISEPT